MAQFEHNSDKFGYLNLETLDGVQAALKALGFDPGKVDGKNGPNTQEAVRRFQARVTIQVDGIVGEQTRSSLMNELDKAQRESATS